MQQYQSVCRKCGFVYLEGVAKEYILNSTKRRRCMMCNAKKWKIIEKDQGDDVIDTTKDSDDEDEDDDDDPSQSSITDY